MQKTKLILRAKAHGAYNKAKKVYSNAVKTYTSAGGDGTSRQSERLRAERETLRVYVEFFEGLKKAFRGAAQERPKREESLFALSSLLARNSPLVGESNPALALLLDAVTALLEGAQDGLRATGEALDHLIPTYLDGFLSVGYGEAKNALAQFDRAAKVLSDSETRLSVLKAQPKPDMSQIGQQEALVQQQSADLDSAEERAYDTLFRVSSDAESVLMRVMSQYLRAWAEYLSAAAAAMESACEALLEERSELPELLLPAAVLVSQPLGGGGGTLASAPSVPSRRAISQPPGALDEAAAHRLASAHLSAPSVAVAAPAGASPPGPSSPYKMAPGPKKQPFKAKAAVGGVGASTPPALTSPLGGEAVLELLMAKESGAPLPPQLTMQAAAPVSLQQATPMSLQDHSVASSSPQVHRGASRPASSVYDPLDVGRKGGRQRVERLPTTSTDVNLEVNDFTGVSYKELAPGEAPGKLNPEHTFFVRCGPKRSVRLTVDLDTKTICTSEQLVPDVVYGVSDLLQFYKATKHFTRLVLRFQGRAKERFEFASMAERERCGELIWAMRGIPLQNAVTLFATSFNLGEARGPETLEHWLPEGYDVYAVGVQECEYIPHRQYNSVEADLFDQIQRHLGSDYIKVAGQSLLSIRLIVMVRRKYALSCTNVKMRKVPCGHLGKVGNKGAVAIAMHVLNSRFCFVTAHLAAHDEKYAERNMDVQNIMSGLKSLVPQGMSPLNYFHGFFFFGDLNYRVELPRDQVLTYLEQGDAELLLRKDQLLRAMGEGAALYGFQEGRVTFVPTYRVLRGREGFSDDKMRVPSWTDRVLWRTLPAADVKLGAYSSCPGVLTSDHRPVFAAFQIPLFKPNLPHSLDIRCSITLTGLQGNLSISPAQGQQGQMTQQPRYTTVAVFCPSLLDPSMPPESSPSGNAQWGDSIGPIAGLVAANPSYVSARHLMLTVRSERRDVVGTACVPLAPAVGAAKHSFQVFLHDERGMYAGSLSGFLTVAFSKKH